MFEGVPWRLWVKKRRKALGLTQAQLANKVSYSIEMVGQVERGLHRPSQGLATLLAEVLEVAAAQRAEFIRVARNDPASVTGATGGLQPGSLRIPGMPATPLIGRIDDVAHVYQALTRPGQRLVTITGPAGVGKTRLAMYMAADLEALYPGGVYWLALAPLSDARLVLNAVSKALGIKESDHQTAQEALLAGLVERQVLVVLDNCEQVREMSSVIAALLEAPSVQILATGRKRLRVRGEQQILLAPLLLPEPSTAPDKLLDYPALALFLARAKETTPDFVLDAGNAALIAQICRALDGLPLALELAAAQIRFLPPAAMLARLHERLSWLVGGAEDLAVHQRTLTEALAWSYDLLNVAQQHLFRRLGVFSGGFTLDAVAAVCGPLDGLEADTLSAITVLHEWNLLQTLGVPVAEPRYGLLETMHEYAAKVLKKSGEEEQMRRNHAEYFLSLAEAVRAGYATTNSEALLEQLENEQANFRAALEWGLSPQGDLETARRLGVVLGWFWELRSHWQEGRHWLTRLLVREDLAADRLSPQLLYCAGRLAYLRGDAEAERLLTESLRLSRQQANVPIQIKALNSLGWAAVSHGESHRAAEFFSESLSLCRAQGEPLASANTLNALGMIMIELGDVATGEQMVQEALELRRQLGDQHGIARSLNALALVAQHRNNWEQARQFSSASVALYSAQSDKLGNALALNTFALTYLAEVQPAEGQIYAAEALRLAQEVGSGWCEAMARCYLGWLELQLGHRVEAMTQLRESLKLAQKHRANYVQVFAYDGLAALALQAADYVQLVANFQAAQQLRQKLPSSILPFQSRLAAELGRAVAAYLASPAASADNTTAA